jgi:hypothetical protein
LQGLKIRNDVLEAELILIELDMSFERFEKNKKPLIFEKNKKAKTE